ncbi:MAG: ECF transporter S component [Clostridia bacterium]|nr:ECF transporter S component [Clostridia bacterium]
MYKLSAAKKITYFSVLTALTFVLQLVGNTVKIGFVTLNFSLIPIVLAAIILGAFYGAALGVITGLIILFNNGILGADGFTNVLFASEPVMITLVCILKTGVAGLLSGLIFKALRNKNSLAAVFIASAIVPVINTALFIVGMLCITGALTSAGFIANAESAFYTIVIVFVGLNFVFEFAVNVIVAPTLFRVITVIDPSFKKTASADYNIDIDDNTDNSDGEN